jgi:hypothetical protein
MNALNIQTLQQIFFTPMFHLSFVGKYQQQERMETLSQRYLGGQSIFLSTVWWSVIISECSCTMFKSDIFRNALWCFERNLSRCLRHKVVIGDGRRMGQASHRSCYYDTCSIVVCVVVHLVTYAFAAVEARAA